MTKLEKLYSIIENSRDVEVKLPEDCRFCMDFIIDSALKITRI